MGKINFSKVEMAISDTLRKIYIAQLADLATLATLINTPTTILSAEKIDQMLKKFRAEFQALKNHDTKLYEKLGLTMKEEKFILSSQTLKPKDWERLSRLKLKIDSLKKELYGQSVVNPEDEQRISLERRKHINKRFNIRDHWLPLH